MVKHVCWMGSIPSGTEELEGFSCFFPYPYHQENALICNYDSMMIWFRGCQKQVAVQDLFFTSRTWAKIWPVESLWYLSVPLLVLSPNCKPSRWITAGYIGIMYGLNHTPPRSFLRKTFKTSTCQPMTLRSSFSQHQRWSTNRHWMIVEGCFQQQA